MEGAGAGFLVGAAILSWYPDPYRFDVKNTRKNFALNSQYVLRGLSGPILWSSVVCGVFSLTECVFEQLRDESKQSTYVNSALAGAAAGAVIGSISKRFDIMATTALGVGALMGMFEYNGQSFHVQDETSEKKWSGRLPPKISDSDTLEALKKKYPEFKHL
jgi:hypothetical protein